MFASYDVNTEDATFAVASIADMVAKGAAAALGIATDDVIVVSGHASPSKIVAVSGMDDETIKKGFG